MEALPELVLIEIFDRLSPCNRLAIRPVCKQWRQLIDEQLSCSTEEVILVYMMEPRPLIWHHCDQPVNLDNSFIVNCKFRSSECFKRLFRSIKRLYIASLSSDINVKVNDPNEIVWSNVQEEFFDHVNCFSKLEHFELYHSRSLDCTNPDRKEAPFEIDLEHLKTFNYETESRDALAKMSSSKLEQLSFFEDFRLPNANFDCFKNSLKLLKVRSFFCDARFELPNLEVIYFGVDLQIEITAFKKLKEIHHFFLPDPRVPFEPDRIKAIFNGLFEQGSRLMRKLSVYFDGNRCEPNSVSVAIERVRLGDWYFYPQVLIRKTDLEFYQKHQNDFRVERLRKHLEYTSELDEVIAQMSDQQIEKLARSLECVTLIGQLSADLLLSSKLRGLFRYVQHLCIHNRFPSGQLELLPGLLPALISLRGAEQSYWQPEELSLCRPLAIPSSLVSKFKGLKDVSIATGPYTVRTCMSVGGVARQVMGGQASPSDVKQILDQCRFLLSLQVRAEELWVSFFNGSNQPSRYRYMGSTEMIKLLQWEKIPYILPYLSGKEQVIEFLVRYGFFRAN